MAAINPALAMADVDVSPAAQTAFDHSIWYLITSWAPMHLALAEKWAGDMTSEKRDWLAGAVSELFVTRPETDAIDVEDVLLQVMADEFEVEVQDESEVIIAREIVRCRNEILIEGRLEVAEDIKRAFLERKGKSVKFTNGGEREEEVGSDEDVEIDGDGDEDMDEAPPLAPVREKIEPEVDEDGFTKVVGKKRR